MTYIVIGGKNDYCCDAIYRILSTEGKDVIKLNYDLIQEVKFTWNYPHEGNIVLDDRYIDFRNIEGVIMRLSDNISGIDEDENYIIQEISSAFFAWIHSLSCVVINKVPPRYWYHEAYDDINEIVKSPGVRTLNSLFTNNVSDSDTFLMKHKSRILIRFLSTHSKIFGLNLGRGRDILKDIVKIVPVKLIEDVGGRRLEVFVIGSKVIITDKIGNLLVGNVRLEKLILSIAKKLGIMFIQLHLIFSHEDSYCYLLGLEVIPDYGQCKEEPRNMITNELVKVLTSKK